MSSLHTENIQQGMNEENGTSKEKNTLLAIFSWNTNLSYRELETS